MTEQEYPMIIFVDWGIAHHYKVTFVEGDYIRCIDINKNLPPEVMDWILVHEYDHFYNYQDGRKSDRWTDIKHMVKTFFSRRFWQLCWWEMDHFTLLDMLGKKKFGLLED